MEDTQARACPVYLYTSTSTREFCWENRLRNRGNLGFSLPAANSSRCTRPPSPLPQLHLPDPHPHLTLEKSLRLPHWHHLLLPGQVHKLQRQHLGLVASPGPTPKRQLTTCRVTCHTSTRSNALHHLSSRGTTRIACEYYSTFVILIHDGVV